MLANTLDIVTKVTMGAKRMKTRVLYFCRHLSFFGVTCFHVTKFEASPFDDFYPVPIGIVCEGKAFHRSAIWLLQKNLVSSKK